METKENTPCDLLSPNEYSILLRTVDENCDVVENLALSTIGSRHIPLLNSMLCMDTDDFQLILDKCQESRNIVDKQLLLVLLTDFISCVCANNYTFPINLRKNQKKRINLLLLQLKNMWKDFFSEVTVENMNVDQRSSLISVITRGLEINKHTNCGIFFKTILKMTHKPNVEAENRRKSKTPVRETFHNTTEAVHLDHSEKNKSKLSNKTPGTPKVKSTEVNTDSVVGSCEKILPDNWFLPIRSEPQKCKNSEIEVTLDFKNKSPLKLVPPKNTIDTGYNIKKKDSSPGKKFGSKNLKINSYDITRFILKPCENNSKAHVEEKQQLSVSLANKCGTTADTSEVTCEPPRKKQCISDDFVNGKINAFKCLMMSRKKHKGNKTV